MIVRCSFLWLFAIAPICLAANLRAGGHANLVTINNDDVEETTPEQHRRRMQTVAAYWTPERVANAIPRDIHIPKPDSSDKEGGKRRRGLLADEEVDIPHHLQEDNRYLWQMEDNQFMEIAVKHEPFESLSDEDRRLKRPVDTHISPAPNAVVNTEYIDFVVDIVDADGSNDLKRIIFLLRDGRRTQRTRFRPSLGNGRYTFTIGPFAEGEYRWAVKVKSRDGRSRKKFDRFTVDKSGGNDGGGGIPTVPAPPRTDPIITTTLPTTTTSTTTTSTTTTTRPTTTTTTTTRPTTTTTTTTTTQQQPPSDGDVDVNYVSPGSGQTVDPVNFEWKVTPHRGSATLVMLIVEYPDGTQAYLTRFPTGDGRDKIEVPLDGGGTFRWSIWTQIDNGSFEPGPWKTFTLTEGPTDPSCPENLGHYTERNQDLHKAVGRIMFRYDSSNYLCSGTLVDGANDRAVIATAAHCVFDQQSGQFPDYVMFIPGQDDGEGDASDYNCSNDPNGCFYPTIGVISSKYQTAGFVDGFQYDYGFYVAPDTDKGNNNGPDRDTYGGSGPYKSLVPMGITFAGLSYGQNTHLFGYPGSRDPLFMYTEGRSDQSPITTGGWYVECSGLTGGASGGPWTQSDPSTGRMAVGSVNSWGWSNGDSGMGSPPYDTGGAECVYDAANSASMSGSHVVANCPA